VDSSAANPTVETDTTGVPSGVHGNSRRWSGRPAGTFPGGANRPNGLVFRALPSTEERLVMGRLTLGFIACVGAVLVLAQSAWAASLSVSATVSSTLISVTAVVTSLT
jgi:hypothetical protein